MHCSSAHSWVWPRPVFSWRIWQRQPLRPSPPLHVRFFSLPVQPPNVTVNCPHIAWYEMPLRTLANHV